MWPSSVALNPAFQKNEPGNFMDFMEHQCLSPTLDPIQQNL